MPEPSRRLSIMESFYLSRLRLLENLQSYTTLRKGTIRDEAPQLKKNLRKPYKIKSLDVTSSATGQWASMGMDKNHSLQALKQVLGIFPHLETMKLKLIKIPSSFEGILTFFDVVSFLPNLHCLEWEFLNCHISDLEVIAFAQGLAKIQQIKYFSLKVIQNLSISEDCIEKVACAISRLPHLSKFNLYFRKLSIHPRGILELGKRIENFGENIQCICSKESIYIYKTVTE